MSIFNVPIVTSSLKNQKTYPPNIVFVFFGDGYYGQAVITYSCDKMPSGFGY